MEFPACDECNQSTRSHDAIFGFFAMALDYNPENLDFETFHARIQHLINNSPEALPYASGEGRLVSWPVEAEVIGVILGP